VPWPSYDKDVIVAEQVEMVIQINGKVRSRVVVPSDIGEEDLKLRVMEDKRIKESINGKKIIKTIVVPKKLVNLVIK
jgi:leucyl-tRNA synthetase